MQHAAGIAIARSALGATAESSLLFIAPNSVRKADHILPDRIAMAVHRRTDRPYRCAVGSRSPDRNGYHLISGDTTDRDLDQYGIRCGDRGDANVELRQARQA